MTEEKEGAKKGEGKVVSGPNIAPIEDPAFTQVITDDLAIESADGLHLTRDPKKDERRRSEPGIRLSDLAPSEDEHETQAEADSEAEAETETEGGTKTKDEEGDQVLPEK